MGIINRYIRQQQLAGFGPEAQKKLSEAKVLVVGAGGLGVPVLQYLCGMGTGTIGIADGDTVCMTNLHRQVLYNERDINKLKAAVAAEKLRKLNSSIIVNVHDEMLTAANAVALIGKYDLVIDATDNFTARYLINDACVITGKPFVYGAIQEWEAQISVFNYKDGPTYRCLYPQQPAIDEIPNCNMAGVLGVVPGIVGCMQALEAVKIITGAGKPLSGYLKIINFENDSSHTIKLPVNTVNKQIKTLSQNLPPFSPTFTNLSPDELFEWYEQGKEFLLIDVREATEYSEQHLKDALNIPLAELAGQKFSTEIPLVIFCKTGGRSQRAAQVLKERNGDLDVYNALGGLDSWLMEMNNKLIEY